MAEVLISKPTETTALSIKVYGKGNADALTTGKRSDIARLYTDRYSSPKWHIPPEELRLDTLSNEMEFAMSARGGMIITVEDERGKVVGFRLVVGFSNIVEAAKADAGLMSTVDAMRKATNYDISEASYTVDTCVSRDMEGRGLGHKMMAVQIEAAKRDGAPAIIGWTVDTNLKMIRLYDSMGYAPICGLIGVTTGSDYNVNYRQGGDEPAFHSEKYAPLTYRHLLLRKEDARDMIRGEA